MILQALTQYYEDLLRLGEITPAGWSKAKVSYALELDDSGQIQYLYDLQSEEQRGKKAVLAPRIMDVPAPVKRTVGIAANFLCDNSGYLLGADGKGKPKRALECFEAAKKLHLEVLQNAPSPAARAVAAFFESWQPAGAAEHPALKARWDDIMKGGNLVFWYDGAPVTDNEEVRQAWQRRYDSRGGGDSAICLVTGSRAPVERLHPTIKGVAGAQSSGASLVSFNAPSFCSYGHEQGGNSPTGEYAAFAYTTALNHLLADKDHVRRIGDTTIVCWAAGGQAAYQAFTLASIFDSDTYTEGDILSALFDLADGKAIDWDESRLDPNTRFYILGLAPNAARLSVRFFWQNSFGTLARNIYRHYDRLNIIKPSNDTLPTLSVWRLVRETVNQNSRTPEPSPRLAGDLLQAVLTDGLYPATLLNGTMLRIRAERKITRGRAAIIKAYYIRNSENEQLKEVMTVALNEQSSYQPYVLGRLFSVLEALQESANPNINATIKDRYFNSASATPATVFPVLINLAQNHLAKLSERTKIYYNQQISELLARLDGETLPKRLTLEEQGAFQIGYYHQTQKRYTKKEEN